MPFVSRRVALGTGFALALSAAASVSCGRAAPKTSAPTTWSAAYVPVDPLPSWNDGASKRAVLEFVMRVSREGSTDYVRPEDRIATFDNDGTLWPEKPLVEGMFVRARIEEQAKTDPSLRTRQPFAAALSGDMQTLEREGKPALLELFIATHTGMTDDVFAAQSRQFLQTSEHPRFHVPYTSLGYQPMIELLVHLRRAGFETYLCSGGDVDFMRTFSNEMYGIPPERVIGSSVEKSFVVENGRSALWRKPAAPSVNDKETKPVGISRQIGKRPLVAAGNVRSTGDVAMLEFGEGRNGPSLGMIVTHDDAVREFAYEEPDNATRVAAQKNGFVLVSMKNDWKRVFGVPVANDTQPSQMPSQNR